MKITISKNAPDFLFVGAAKSGTTSIWYYLDQHPDVFVNHGTKELGYFSDHYGVSSLNEYLSYFESAKEQQLIGEVCHSYLSSPECAVRIYNFNPRMKICMMLRNPIQRAYSLYNWMIQNGYEHIESFQEALNREEIRRNDVNFKEHSFYYMNYLYLHSGLYYEQVKRYIDTFGIENCLILFFDDFIGNELKVMNQVFTFLGVKNLDTLNIEAQNISKDVRSAKVNFFLNYYLSGYCKKLFIPKVIEKSIHKLINRLNNPERATPKLDSETYNKLIPFFEEDILKLSKLVGKDLSNWIKKR